MRGRFLFVIILIAAVWTLTACEKTVECPADELEQASWRGEWDNGTAASLSFSDGNADLIIRDPQGQLEFKGLAILTDDRVTICDERSKRQYTFGYLVYGDRVELSYNNGTLSLAKIK